MSFNTLFGVQEFRGRVTKLKIFESFFRGTRKFQLNSNKPDATIVWGNFSHKFLSVFSLFSVVFAPTKPWIRVYMSLEFEWMNWFYSWFCWLIWSNFEGNIWWESLLEALLSGGISLFVVDIFAYQGCAHSILRILIYMEPNLPSYLVIETLLLLESIGGLSSFWCLCYLQTLRAHLICVVNITLSCQIC